MLVLAHRGYHIDYPENTMQAFDAAVRLGVDGIETDVRLSRDGLPVLVHDEKVAGKPVHDLSRHDIERWIGHHVPTVTEVMLEFPGVIWNFEIKVPEALGETIQSLTVFRRTRRLLITSFRPDLAEQAARALGCDAGLVLARAPSDLGLLLRVYGTAPTLRTLVWPWDDAPYAAREAAREAGWHNLAWGIRNPDEHRRLLERNYEGVITDHPELVPEELRRRARPAG
jgi:glycerophosphoryl diester phosphodiesterase